MKKLIATLKPNKKLPFGVCEYISGSFISSSISSSSVVVGLSSADFTVE